MRESQVEGGPSLESLGLSIKKTAEITADHLSAQTVPFVNPAPII